jgi:hypothetical protein
MSQDTENMNTEVVTQAPMPALPNKPVELPPSPSGHAQFQNDLGNASMAAAAADGSAANSKRSSWRFQNGYGNAAIARLLIQRKAEDAAPQTSQPAPSQPGPLQAALPQPTLSAPAGSVPTASPLIVEDNAELGPGQMKKTEFLSHLLTSIRSATEEVLADTVWSLAADPYVDRWLNQYRNQTAGQLEQTIRRYASEAASVTAASAYLPIVRDRVRRSLTAWKTTGEITGLPSGLAQGLPDGGLMGAPGNAISAVGDAGSSVSSGVMRGISRAKNIFLKHQDGAADRNGDDPRPIQSQLGNGALLDENIRSQMESAYGENFHDVRVHTDSTAASVAQNVGARAFTIGQEIAFARGEYQPGTLIGDALIAHELAHVAQQRGAVASDVVAQKGAAGYANLEEDADLAAVNATVSIWGKTKAGFASLASKATPGLRSGLRLQRCDRAKAPSDLVSAEQKATWIKSAMEEDKSGTSDAIVEVFKTSESPSEFLSIQKSLDMAAVIDYLTVWTAVQVGTLGPVLAGQDKLNNKRAEYVVKATHDYGPNRGQVFVHFMFATMHTDDMRAVLAILAQEKRLGQTILLMDAIKDLMTERGIKPGEYTDRAEGLGDVARGVGETLSDFMSSSEAAKMGTSMRYYSEMRGLPEEYGKLLSEVEKKEFEAAMSPGNVALGTADYLTFGVISGTVGLVKGTVKGTWDVAHGRYEQGASELTGAALVLAAYLGVKAYQKLGAPKTVVGPAGPGQFVIKGFQGPIPKEVARLGAILALNADGQAMSGLLISRIGQKGMLDVARFVQADSQAAILVYERGLPAVEALHKTEGNVAKARAMLPPEPAGLLPATTEGGATGPVKTVVAGEVAGEVAATSVPGLTIPQRLAKFYERLRLAPRAKSSEQGLNQIRTILDEVEDEFSGVPKKSPPPTPAEFDGRMYPPMNDFVERKPDGSMTAKTRGHAIEITADGKITITNRKSGKVEFEK